MRELRVKARLTQKKMAKLLGFTCRGYQELEGGRTPFAPRHIAVVERLSLRLAAERNDPSLTLPSVARALCDIDEPEPA